jgi:hypothetical protein
MGGVILLGLVFGAIYFLVLKLIRKPGPPPSTSRHVDVVLSLDEHRTTLRNTPPPEPEDSTKQE